MAETIDAESGRAVTGPRADYFCERCAKQDVCSPENPWRDLPLKFDAKGNEKKPRCPECNATRWMRRLYSGYSPRVSGTRLTPTQLGSGANGKEMVAASDMLGPAGYDDQKARRAALLRRSNNPNMPRIVDPRNLGAALAQATGGAFQGIPGVQPGATTVESIRPIRTEGGLTRHLAPPRPGPGSLVAPDKMP